jgi:hypothetical protein
VAGTQTALAAVAADVQTVMVFAFAAIDKQKHQLEADW